MAHGNTFFLKVPPLHILRHLPNVPGVKLFNYRLGKQRLQPRGKLHDDDESFVEAAISVQSENGSAMGMA